MVAKLSRGTGRLGFNDLCLVRDGFYAPEQRWWPQRFCSKDCRQNFNTTCRIWGAREYEGERVSIFELRTLLGQHTRCVQRDSAPEGCQSTTPAPARSDAA